MQNVMEPSEILADLEKLSSFIEELNVDIPKMLHGNAQAGKRARRNLRNLKKTSTKIITLSIKDAYERLEANRNKLANK